MKVWKLVSGILSIILFVVVMLQSCAAGFINAVEDNGGTSGSAGVMVGIFMLAGGIVSIATRNKTGKGVNIALIILFGLAAVIGLAGYGNYSDLIIWSIWCLVNAVLAGVCIVKNKAE